MRNKVYRLVALVDVFSHDLCLEYWIGESGNGYTYTGNPGLARVYSTHELAEIGRAHAGIELGIGQSAIRIEEVA